MKLVLLIGALLSASIAMACPSDKLCVGDRIMDDSDRVGSVLEIFSNGKVSVALDGGAYNSYVKEASTLGKGVPCQDNICVKNRIIDSSDRVGVVMEVFDNGKALLVLEGGAFPSYVRKTDDLGRAYRCIENLCMGDRIIDASNRVGKVLEIFDNGKVKVSLDGGAYPSYIRTFDQLGIQLNCRLRENCSCRN